jgi:hypothetical protein
MAGTRAKASVPAIFGGILDGIQEISGLHYRVQMPRRWSNLGYEPNWRDGRLLFAVGEIPNFPQYGSGILSVVSGIVYICH